MLKLLLLLQAAASGAAAGGGCSSALDCHLNGRCTAGACVCKPWWRGPTCTLLNFEPAATIEQGIHQEGVSTWGGSVIRSEKDGLYHAHAAEMLAGCGISAW